MAIGDAKNNVREELNLGEIESNLVNNVVPKPKEFGESSRKNTLFMRLRYIPLERVTNFSFRYIPKKTTSFEEISLTPIS